MCMVEQRDVGVISHSIKLLKAAINFPIETERNVRDRTKKKNSENVVSLKFFDGKRKRVFFCFSNIYFVAATRHLASVCVTRKRAGIRIDGWNRDCASAGGPLLRCHFGQLWGAMANGFLRLQTLVGPSQGCCWPSNNNGKNYRYRKSVYLLELTKTPSLAWLERSQSTVTY